MKLPVVPEQPWYADGLSFSCTQCGNCCTGGPGYVWISDQELERLGRHLSMPVEEVVRRFCRKIRGRWSLKESRRGDLYDCIFLQEIQVGAERSTGERLLQKRRICAIYEVRPLQCRTWPFWEGNLASNQAWTEAARTCPGMDRGRRYSLPQIVALRDARDWPDRAPGSDS
jgi:Fe-S-cluster containining protein